uniref:RING-type domain-containing protein n=1 Tax=Meloidogyne incognita TaxID=6306 RepID=A0A914N7L6_MELIC
MVYYKFGRCTVDQLRLRPDNVYTLRNCNHTFHKECITHWITEGSQDCPRCRAPAALTDIKQLIVEEAGDSSDDSGDELIQSSSNVITKNENKEICDLTIKLNNLACKYANFVKIKNKWSEIDTKYNCCDNNCINTFEPMGKCTEGNGFSAIQLKYEMVNHFFLQKLKDFVCVHIYPLNLPSIQASFFVFDHILPLFLVND